MKGQSDYIVRACVKHIRPQTQIQSSSWAVIGDIALLGKHKPYHGKEQSVDAVSLEIPQLLAAVGI